MTMKRMTITAVTAVVTMMIVKTITVDPVVEMIIAGPAEGIERIRGRLVGTVNKWCDLASSSEAYSRLVYDSSHG